VASIDKRVERREHLVTCVDIVRWTVELHEVDAIGAQIRARALVPGKEVSRAVVGEGLRTTPAHLCRNQNVGVSREQLAAELLAAPIAIDIGSVEERDTLIHR
jgi:hypothetical protein